MRFREQFNAAVVAVARKGERIRAKTGDIKLRAGDILLLDTGSAFAQQHRDSKYFSIVIEMENTNPVRLAFAAGLARGLQSLIQQKQLLQNGYPEVRFCGRLLHGALPMP